MWKFHLELEKMPSKVRTHLMCASIRNPFRLVYYILFNPLFFGKKKNLFDRPTLEIFIKLHETRFFLFGPYYCTGWGDTGAWDGSPSTELGRCLCGGGGSGSTMRHCCVCTSAWNWSENWKAIIGEVCDSIINLKSIFHPKFQPNLCPGQLPKNAQNILSFIFPWPFSGLMFRE